MAGPGGLPLALRLSEGLGSTGDYPDMGGQAECLGWPLAHTVKVEVACTGSISAARAMARGTNGTSDCCATNKLTLMSTLGRASQFPTNRKARR